MLYGLDIFSGIGGITLALKDWVRPIAYCENDPYCQGVLLSRMQSHELPIAPIWDDIKTLSGKYLPKVDIIYGGFPCQDISVAGNGKGLEGKRSCLFFEIMRLAEEIKSKFVFLENVPAIRTRGLGVILKEFTKAGYDCRYGFLSAYDVGAPHKRERWFLLAYTRSKRRQQESRSTHENESTNEGRGEKKANIPTSCCKRNREGNVAHPNKLTLHLAGFDSKFRKLRNTPKVQQNFPPWGLEPEVGRVADGVPLRVGQLKHLGNAVVPQQAKEAFRRLVGLTSEVTNGKK